ncbi:LysR family transcriptional regulator [Alkalihalobacillus sp. CinArs1]|uniref:LysR family transcriptional regulator n=1 Tax=Alkalihalobacillus sp. CinArs1 TaxID=2995314 RepID=UPI0022DE5DB0|nr:LysR family transcriptional regulator [Alkalihalobacillus sp. CinArs1]
MLLHKLKYFIEIADKRSFTKAAEACFVSQPALSKQMKFLEEELGFALFNRSIRGVELTRKGRSLYEDLSPLFSKIDQTVHHYKQFDHIRFGSTPLLSSYFLPSYYEKLQYTNLHVTVVQNDSRDLVPLLKAHDIDAAIVQDTPSIEGIYSTLLFQEPFVAAIPVSYALSSRKEVTMEECFAYKQILPPEGSLSEQVTNIMQEKGIGVDVLETHYLGMVGLVSIGIGIAYLPKMMADAIEHKGVTFVPIKSGVLERKMYLHAVSPSILKLLSDTMR